MDLFARPKAPLVEASCLEKLSEEELRAIALMPVGGIPAGPDQRKHANQWMAANWEVARRIRNAEIAEFAGQGSAQNWFSKWKPSCPALKELSATMECAHDVVESLYAPILSRGLSRSEDMGLLMSSRCGNAEGILAKYAPYDQSCLHIEIHCVTGPWNFDPSENKAYFEPGAKSHVIHLAYEKLPSQADLEADVCTYPLIRDPSNLYIDKYGKPLTYLSEGLIGPITKNGIKVHRPWNSLSSECQTALIQHTQI